jgi:hypothetical protein
MGDRDPPPRLDERKARGEGRDPRRRARGPALLLLLLLLLLLADLEEDGLYERVSTR